MIALHLQHGDHGLMLRGACAQCGRVLALQIMDAVTFDSFLAAIPKSARGLIPNDIPVTGDGGALLCSGCSMVLVDGVKMYRTISTGPHSVDVHDPVFETITFRFADDG
jgi:hypothetical protein